MSGVASIAGSAHRDLLATHGVPLAAMLAAAAASPSLWLPFLADDWADLANVAPGPTQVTPFGYFRPLCMVTYWVEQKIWGRSPSLCHLTNLIMIAMVAALVVILIRRYTGDAHLAGVAGVLFALHPYHIENSAWVAGRADILFSLLFLGAALAYDQWRTTCVGVPFAALALSSGALASKETAVVLPLFVLMLGILDKSRRPTMMEWRQGYLPMIGLTAAHFMIWRRLALGGLGLTALNGFGGRSLKNLMAFGVAAALPAQTEFLEERPLQWGVLGVITIGALLFAARSHSGRIPGLGWISAIMFVVLLGPSLISFQERYILLPSAASALALATLLVAADRRARATAVLMLLPVWLVCGAEQWAGWFEAGDVSTRVIDGLVQAASRPGVHEIIVANMPHRVQGAPIAADFGAAVALSGGNAVAIRTAVAVDIPGSRADALDGPLASAIHYPPPFAEIRLRIVERRFSRYVWPLRPETSDRIDTGWGTLYFDQAGIVRVLISPAPERGRAAYFWSARELKALF